MHTLKIALLGFLTFSGTILRGQQDSSVFLADSSAAQEEDYSIYETMVPADQEGARWASSKIFDLSPQKLISIGYDYQGPYTIESNWKQGAPQAGSYKTNSSNGLRLGFSIPVISKNRLTWAISGNYLENRYNPDGYYPQVITLQTALMNSLNRGIRSAGLGTTVYVPLNATRFVLFQAQADLNGDYGWNDFTDYLNKTKFSGAALYGFRPHDRLQWGIGLSRTYRVGEVNYIPVLMYNYTWPGRKWGTEILFPARAAVRHTLSARQLLLFGYELEGQSYALNQSANDVDFHTFNVHAAELRRGEARVRLTWERSLSGFIWLSVQAGMRFNTAFNLDDGNFFRGPFGNQAYVMEGDAGVTPYALVSINLVSP